MADCPLRAPLLPCVTTAVLLPDDEPVVLMNERRGKNDLHSVQCIAASAKWLERLFVFLALCSARETPDRWVVYRRKRRKTNKKLRLSRCRRFGAMLNCHALGVWSVPGLEPTWTFELGTLRTKAA